MFLPFRGVLLAAMLFVFAGGVLAQVDEICGEFGFMPTLDAPRLSAPYIFGRVTVNGVAAGAPLPKVTVTYMSRSGSPERITVGKKGSYCFRQSGGGGNLVVEMDGVEVARRGISSFGTAQQREDFELDANRSRQLLAPPSVISSQFPHSRNEKAVELFRQASEAETKKDIGAAVKLMREVVAADDADFIAWAYLGTLYLEQNKLSDADAALKKALQLRVEYTPAWVNVGKVRVAQKAYEPAVEIFKHVLTLDPESARTYQLLGEAYLLNKQGSLGAEALNKAIELDPEGMADVHLQLAHLYQLAKANRFAAEEYKKFLEKRPNHPDKKKFEKFIADNPQ